MINFIFKRLILLVTTLFFVVTLSYLILELLPGSPFNDPFLPEEHKLYLLETYGFNDISVHRYFTYIFNIFKGDLGFSFVYKNQNVSEIITENVGITAKIGLLGFSMGLFIGIVLGVIAALNHNKIWDHISNFLTILGIALPSFVVAALMQYFLGYKWNFLPIIYEIDPNTSKQFFSMIMPSLSLALFVVAMTMRMVRNELIEIMNQEYFLFAQAKGMTRRKAVFKHGLKNTLVSLTTVVGPIFLVVITGSTIVERFFGIPGLSSMMIKAVQSRDYFLVTGIALTYSFGFSLMLLIVDILYMLIDPRIRIGGKIDG